ncbi:MAG: hypothetical protein KAW17_03510 [Candidatus Eisenbacteria sp.]|nr:hypothetical protein [Candidatus Eisenbacteria bacterium]
MSNDAHWAAARITEARKLHASVTEAVSARIEELLNGQLSERQLRPTELTSVAAALISDMVPPPPKLETKQ